MEQIKYIPGDLVYIPKFCNNYTIMNSGKCYYEALDENNNDVVIENTDIVPIPLTPEILEKNGWKVRLDGFHYFIKPNKDYPSIWELCRGNTRYRFKKIKYVHQLQHFIFGLDLNSDMKL